MASQSILCIGSSSSVLSDPSGKIFWSLSLLLTHSKSATGTKLLTETLPASQGSPFSTWALPLSGED